MSSRSSSSNGMSAAESVTTATRRPVACAECCCRCMSSAFSPLTAPKRAATRNTSAGSLTWMCTRTLSCRPATTRLLPSVESCSRRWRRSTRSADDHALGAVAVREVFLRARRHFGELRLVQRRHQHRGIVLASRWRCSRSCPRSARRSPARPRPRRSPCAAPRAGRWCARAMRAPRPRPGAATPRNRARPRAARRATRARSR